MKKLALPLLIAFVSSNAYALTLKEKKKLEGWTTELGKKTEQVQKKCGVAIPSTLDEKMVTPFMEANASAAGYCGEVSNAIASMCGDATAKGAITAKIKKISCQLGGKGEAELKLAGDELRFTVGPGASNVGEKTRKFLENNL